MSVESSTNFISFVGNNSTSVPYAITTFFWYKDTDLIVTVTDNAGNATVLTLNTDYAVSDSGDPNGGSIVTTAAVPITSTVAIERVLPLIQEAEYNENDAFPSALTGTALDKLIMICQQIQRGVSNSLRVLSATVLNPFSFRANTVLVFGATQPGTMTADELLSFLGATGTTITADRATMVFTNAGIRAAAVPAFTGQVGIQLDTKQIYTSTSTSAGAWSLYVGATQVFADSTARGLAVPAFSGQLGIQINTTTVYYATGTSAGNWATTTASTSIADGSVTFAKLATSATVFMRGVYKLAITRPTTSTLLVSLDECVLPDGSGGYMRHTAPSPITCTISTSGANGLDTGSEASNTWYYVYLIPNGTTLATLFSTSATAPTMPSGYMYKLLISAVRNDGSSNIIQMVQYGNRVYVTPQLALSNQNYGDGVTPNTPSIANFIPPIAYRVSGVVWSLVTAKDLGFSVASTVNAAGRVVVQGKSATSVIPFNGHSWSGSFDILTSGTTLSINSSNHVYSVDIVGYEFNF